MSIILEAARAYLAAGLSVIPIGDDKRPFWSRLPQLAGPPQLVSRKAGSRCVGARRLAPRRKRARGVWKPFRYRRATEAELMSWFGDGRANVGLVGGTISGGLLVLDFDREADEIFPAWQERVGALAERLPVVATRQGVHVYLRTPSALGNLTLARAADGGKRIETRGAGGYVLAPPSRHPSGHVYHWLHGDHRYIPVLTGQAVTAVLDAARAFDAKPKRTAKAKWRHRSVAAGLPTGMDGSERLQRYARAALRREAETLAGRAPGGRNDGLNRAAFSLGRYVGAGLLATEQVAEALHRACRANGLIADDGEPSFWRTFISGLSAGRSHAIPPADLLARLNGVREAAK